MKALDHCEFAFQKFKDYICINPYHYEKTGQEPLTILVPKSLPGTSGEYTNTYSYDDLRNTVPDNIQYSNSIR